MRRDGYEAQPAFAEPEPEQQTEARLQKGLEVFAQALTSISTLAQAGIANAEGSEPNGLSLVVKKVVFEHCLTPQVTPKKGVIFPLRAGVLEGFVKRLRRCTLEEALQPTFVASCEQMV